MRQDSEGNNNTNKRPPSWSPLLKPSWRENPVEQAQQEPRLQDYLRILKKRRRLFWGFGLLGLFTALLLNGITPRIYRSTVKFEVQQQNNFIIRTDPLGGFSSRLTPSALQELIESEPYQSLADALLTLSIGYGIDLSRLRSQEEMTRLFEKDLFRYPLVQYFERLMIQAVPPGPTARLLPELQTKDPVLGAQSVGTPENLTAYHKDLVIQQAGALSALARRFSLNLFRVPPGDQETIARSAKQIMNSSLLRNLPNDPLQGKRWEQLTPAEKGWAVLSAYRQIRKEKPDPIDRIADREKTKTREIPDTGMLELAFESPDRYRAMLGADAYACVVIWKTRSGAKEEASTQRLFIERTLFGPDYRSGLRKRLTEIDQQMAQYKKRNNILDVDAEIKVRAEQMADLLSRLREAEYLYEDTQRQYQALQSQARMVQPRLQTPTSLENPVIANLKENLASAESDLQALLARYQPSHPYVKAAQAKVDRIQQSLSEEILKQPKSAQTQIQANPLYQDLQKSLAELQAKLVGLQARKNALQKIAANYQSRLAFLPNKQQTLLQWMTDRLVLQKEYEFLAERHIEAQLNENTKLSPARVVEMAIEPGKKVRPRVKLNLLLGLFAGLLAGLMMALAAESLDNTIYTREEVERLLPEVPLITEIPLQTAQPSSPLPEAKGYSPMTEAFYALRRNLVFIRQDKPFRTLLVTSTVSGEGKTTTALHLASALARAGFRTILVDANLRSPQLHHFFNLSNDQGLTTLLQEKAQLPEVIQATDQPLLWILPSGPEVPHPTELLENPSLKRITEDLCRQAEMVLFDSAPILGYVDSLVLASQLDGVLLVLGSGEAPRPVITRAFHTLQQAHAQVLGVVLNKTDISLNGFITPTPRRFQLPTIKKR